MKQTTKENILVTAWIAVFFVFIALFFNALRVDAERFNECVETAEFVEECL